MEGFEGFDFGSDVVNEFASKSSGAYKIKDQELLKGAEFASTATRGPRRALENLHESAWFSHHLANRTAFLATVCLVVTLAVGTFALVFAIGMVKTHPSAVAPPPPATASPSASAATAASGPSASEIVGTVVCGALTFLISINLFRYCLDLFQFSRAAAEAVNKSEEMAAGREPDATKVQSLLFEYQIARQGAPMIPTIIWRWNHTRIGWAVARGK